MELVILTSVQVQPGKAVDPNTFPKAGYAYKYNCVYNMQNSQIVSARHFRWMMQSIFKCIVKADYPTKEETYEHYEHSGNHETD